MASAAAAFLATHLLGGESDFAAVLRLVRALALSGQILFHVEIDGVIVGLDAEDGIVEFGLLTGSGAVDFQNVQFHSA